MNIDTNALEADLIKQFIIYQWRLDNPWPQPDETFEDMKLKYSNDPLFHAKVATMVGGVMDIFNRHIIGGAIVDSEERPCPHCGTGKLEAYTLHVCSKCGHER